MLFVSIIEKSVAELCHADVNQKTIHARIKISFPAFQFSRHNLIGYIIYGLRSKYIKRYPTE